MGLARHSPANGFAILNAHKLMHINGLPIVICTGYYQGFFMAWQLWVYESMILTDNPWNLNPGFKSCWKQPGIQSCLLGLVHWFGSTPWISGTAAAAVNGYEHVLNPPYMIKDVSYWVNYELLRHHQKGDWEAEEQHGLGWTIRGVREE